MATGTLVKAAGTYKGLELPSLSNSNDEYNYPSDLIDPKIKQTKEYVLQYMKCAYHFHYNNRCLVTAGKRQEWVEKRRYADGNQSNLKYVNQITHLKDAQNQPVSYNDLDQRPLKLVPEMLDIVCSRLEKIDYDVYCDSIHPEAHLEREQLKWDMWARAVTKPFFDAMEQKSGVPVGEKTEGLPKNLQELDLMMQYTVRLNTEMEMELGQQMVLTENDFNETKKMWIRDAVNLGVMMRSCEIDRISGRVRFSYEDPCNAILEDYRGHKSKMQRRGVFRQMTIAQAMLRWGSQFTKEEYFAMAKSACGRWGNVTDIGTWDDYINTDRQYNGYGAYGAYSNWENNVITVMDYEWDTCDRLKFERRTLHGNVMTFDRPFNTPLRKDTSVLDDGTMYEREVYATDIKTVYGGEWVVGTEYVANWGKKVNIPRPNENPKECYGKFDFYRIANTSLLDRMLPYIDAMQLKWLRIQNTCARAVPSGFFIKESAFLDVLIDGKPKTQKELLEMGFQTGIFVVSDKSTLDDDRPNQSTKPIEKFESDIGVELTALYNGFIMDRQNMERDTGINEFVNASTPDQNALVGIKDAAVSGADNAIYPILAGFISFHESLCTTITLNMQLLSRYKKISGYVPSLGVSSTRFIEITSNIDKTLHGSPVMYGIRVQARATQEQKQSLLRYIDAAIANSQQPGGGGLDVTDGIELSRLIHNGTNLKLVVAIMADRMKKYREENHAREMEKIEAQKVATQESAVTASQEAMKLEQMKVAAEKELYTHKTNEDIRKLREDFRLRMTQDTNKGEVQKSVEAAKPQSSKAA